jgi:hypothetical protein
MKHLGNLKTLRIAGKSKTTLRKSGWADMDIALKMSEAFNAGWFPEDDVDPHEERDIVLKATVRHRRLVRKPRVWYARTAR